MTRPSGRRRNAVLWLVPVLAVVTVVVLALARPATRPDPATPRGTVGSYVAAVLAGDSVAAAALLAPTSPCRVTDLDSARVGDRTTVDVVRTDVDGTTALVRLRVGPGPDPFGTTGDEVTVRLVRVASGWRLDGVPWPLYECTGG